MKDGRNWTGFALVAAVVAAATLGTAFALTFTGLSFYDDTGYMLALIGQFNAHGGLYTRVYSQYGPFYSEFYGLVCRGLGVPVTHDGLCGVAVAGWLAASVAGGALAFRLTGRLLDAALTQGFCFLSLNVLYKGAGHPVDLCVLCLAAAAVCLPTPGGGGETGSVGPWGRAVGFGAALGALAMVKINLGVFALAAVGTAWAFSTPLDRVGRALRVGAGVLLCALPVALVGAAWPLSAQLPFLALVLATFAGMLLVMARDRAALGWREAGRLGLGMLGRMGGHGGGVRGGDRGVGQPSGGRAGRRAAASAGAGNGLHALAADELRAAGTGRGGAGRRGGVAVPGPGGRAGAV